MNEADTSEIDPESGCRLPLPNKDELDEVGRALYETIANKGPGSIRGLKGPSGVHLHSPTFARLAQQLNCFLRYESGLSGRVRELAILTTARECDSQYEWVAHESEARKEGISQDLIEIVRHRRPLTGVAVEDATVIALGREMFGDRKVSSKTFAGALRQFGRRDLVNLVALMGNYAGTAALLVAFDMQLDAGVDPPLSLR